MNQEEHEELARKLSAIEAPPPPEGLLDKLRADIPDEFPVANRTRTRHITGWSLGLAASIMMMIGAAYFAVSYQKSASFEVASPEPARSAAVAQKKPSSVVPASGTLQPTPAEAQAIEEQGGLRAETDRGEAKTLSKQVLADKRDDLAPPPPPAPKPQIAYAPEAPPADAAESRAVSGVEGGVAGGAVDSVAATRENESSESARNQAMEPQRSSAKDAAAPAVAAAPAPAQLRMKSEALAPLRVGGAIPAPRIVRSFVPVLSDEAKRANVRGVVVVDTTIDREGNVISTRLLKGLPYGVGDAVLESVRRWKFEPTVVDGRAVTVVYEIGVKVGE